MAPTTGDQFAPPSVLTCHWMLNGAGGLPSASDVKVTTDPDMMVTIPAGWSENMGAYCTVSTALAVGMLLDIKLLKSARYWKPFIDG